MNPLHPKLFKASGTPQYHTGHTVGLERRKEFVAAGEVLYQETEKLIPGLRYEAYHSAAGHSVKLRGRIHGSGIKFTIASEWDNQAQGYALTARAVVVHLVRFKLVGLLETAPSLPVSPPSGQNVGQKVIDAENSVRSAIAECVKNELLQARGPEIQTILDGLIPDPTSIQKAQTGVVNNKKRSKGLARKRALEKLAEAMRGQDFTEEEVIEAWQMAQVEHVMES